MAWIRSQYRCNLIAPTDIWVEVKSIWAVVSDYDARTKIGEFETPEAALAELDRIERWIADGAQGVYQVVGE